ncbi:MAG TPA: Stf0 family sulfotransferase [Anaerolineales bacterium]|nr:Stf0 family sulfotransferase [Anaerolineales bacterium]
MKPKLSYTIWFSQRTGSTLLCQALESTGVAGVPREWFNCPPDLLTTFKKADHAELQEYLFKLGTTDNGIFAINHSFYEPHFSQLIETLRKLPACPSEPISRTEVWEQVFPNHRHIFMTRRNKIRLAVSWWRAIQSGEWHIPSGELRKPVDLSNAYSFDAINHLYMECSMREAGIGEFFAEGNITPLNIFYEDFVQNYEGTIRTILDYLELDTTSATIAPPALIKTADVISEEWVQRFREERQENWTNKGW